MTHSDKLEIMYKERKNFTFSISGNPCPNVTWFHKNDLKHTGASICESYTVSFENIDKTAAEDNVLIAENIYGRVVYHVDLHVSCPSSKTYCLNNGVCNDGSPWITCNCTSVSFSGELCENFCNPQYIEITSIKDFRNNTHFKYLGVYELIKNTKKHLTYQRIIMKEEEFRITFGPKGGYHNDKIVFEYLEESRSNCIINMDYKFRSGDIQIKLFDASLLNIKNSLINCPDNMHNCGERCIPEVHWCDDLVDCINYSDEDFETCNSNCSKSLFFNTNETLPTSDRNTTNLESFIRRYNVVVDDDKIHKNQENGSLLVQGKYIYHSMEDENTFHKNVYDIIYNYTEKAWFIVTHENEKHHKKTIWWKLPQSGRCIDNPSLRQKWISNYLDIIPLYEMKTISLLENTRNINKIALSGEFYEEFNTADMVMVNGTAEDKGVFLCENGEQYIPIEYVCDGIKDCSDSSDLCISQNDLKRLSVTIKKHLEISEKLSITLNINISYPYYNNHGTLKGVAYQIEYGENKIAGAKKSSIKGRNYTIEIERKKVTLGKKMILKVVPLTIAMLRKATIKNSTDIFFNMPHSSVHSIDLDTSTFYCLKNGTDYELSRSHICDGIDDCDKEVGSATADERLELCQGQHRFHFYKILFGILAVVFIFTFILALNCTACHNCYKDTNFIDFQIKKIKLSLSSLQVKDITTVIPFLFFISEGKNENIELLQEFSKGQKQKINILSILETQRFKKDKNSKNFIESYQSWFSHFMYFCTECFSSCGNNTDYSEVANKKVETDENVSLQAYCTISDQNSESEVEEKSEVKSDTSDLQSVMWKAIQFIFSFAFKITLCIFYHVDIMKDVAFVVILHHYDTKIVEENYIENFKRRKEVYLSEQKYDSVIKPPFYLEVWQLWFTILISIGASYIGIIFYSLLSKKSGNLYRIHPICSPTKHQIITMIVKIIEWPFYLLLSPLFSTIWIFAEKNRLLYEESYNVKQKKTAEKYVQQNYIKERKLRLEIVSNHHSIIENSLETLCQIVITSIVFITLSTLMRDSKYPLEVIVVFNSISILNMIRTFVKYETATATDVSFWTTMYFYFLYTTLLLLKLMVYCFSFLNYPIYLCIPISMSILVQWIFLSQSLKSTNFNTMAAEEKYVHILASSILPVTCPRPLKNNGYKELKWCNKCLNLEAQCTCHQLMERIVGILLFFTQLVFLILVTFIIHYFNILEPSEIWEDKPYQRYLLSNLGDKKVYATFLALLGFLMFLVVLWYFCYDSNGNKSSLPSMNMKINFEPIKHLIEYAKGFLAYGVQFEDITGNNIFKVHIICIYFQFFIFNKEVLVVSTG